MVGCEICDGCWKFYINNDYYFGLLLVMASRLLFPYVIWTFLVLVFNIYFPLTDKKKMVLAPLLKVNSTAFIRIICTLELIIKINNF